MENGPFEDVFPIENWDIPASYVSLLEGIHPLDYFFQASLDSALDGEIQLPKTHAFFETKKPVDLSRFFKSHAREVRASFLR